MNIGHHTRLLLGYEVQSCFAVVIQIALINFFLNILALAPLPAELVKSSPEGKLAL